MPPSCNTQSIPSTHHKHHPPHFLVQHQVPEHLPRHLRESEVGHLGVCRYAALHHLLRHVQPKRIDGLIA